jgi:hypothetical protein
MKKFLLIALIGLTLGMLAGTQARAQSQVLLPLALGDSLSMSTSSDTVTKVIPVTGGYATFKIQVNVTKLSGTVIGKAYLYTSLDGVNYQITDSSGAFTDQTTNVAWFSKTPPSDTYYKVQVRPMGGATGTMAAIVRVYFVAKLYQAR